MEHTLRNRFLWKVDRNGIEWICHNRSIFKWFLKQKTALQPFFAEFKEYFENIYINERENQHFIKKTLQSSINFYISKINSLNAYRFDYKSIWFNGFNSVVFHFVAFNILFSQS